MIPRGPLDRLRLAATDPMVATVRTDDLRELLSTYDALLATHHERTAILASLTGVVDVRLCAKPRCEAQS